MMPQKMTMPMRRRRPTPQRDIRAPVPLPYDATAVSPHERDVARFQAEDARTGMQTDEVAPTMVQGPPKLSALQNLRKYLTRRRGRK